MTAEAQSIAITTIVVAGIVAVIMVVSSCENNSAKNELETFKTLSEQGYVKKMVPGQAYPQWVKEPQ